MVATRGLTIDEVKGDTDWSALKEELLAACATGRVAAAMNDDPPELSEPPTAAEKVAAFRPADTQDTARRVRPALIRYLLEGGCPDGVRPDPKGVHLRGGWIDGEIDLRGCRTELDLALHHCLFPLRPSYRDAELGGLYLPGSRAEKGLDLHRLQVETYLHLSEAFHATRLVDLAGARIGGQLAFVNGRFDGAGGSALDADAATMGAEVLLSNGFHATGEVNLCGAQITGQLVCTGGRFDGAGGRALNADATTVGAQVFLNDGFHATGEVNIRAARITGQMACTGGRFDGAGGRALTAEAATIGADVFLRGAFHATGPVNFIRARIEGLLQVDQATLADGIDLEAARIREGLFWRDLRGDCAKIDLTDASCGMLCDDRESWARTRKISLSGFSL